MRQLFLYLVTAIINLLTVSVAEWSTLEAQATYIKVFYDSDADGTYEDLVNLKGDISPTGFDPSYFSSCCFEFGSHVAG